VLRINEMLALPCHKGCDQYGAQMGRRSQTQGEPELLHLQKLRWVGGDYDTGGAYWGGGRGSDPIYCAFSPEDSPNDDPVMVFVRAKNREEAKRLVLDELDGDGWGFLDKRGAPKRLVKESKVVAGYKVSIDHRTITVTAPQLGPGDRLVAKHQYADVGPAVRSYNCYLNKPSGVTKFVRRHPCA
jgi:hypothetical protein